MSGAFCRTLAIAVLLLCTFPALHAQSQDTIWYKTELHFEHSRHNVSAISDGEWQSFSERYILPCLPEGYTIYYASIFVKGKKDRMPLSDKLCVLTVIHHDKSAKDYCLSAMVRHFRESFPGLSVTRIDMLISRGNR